MAGFRDEVAASDEPVKGKIRTPTGFDSENAFLEDMRKKFGEGQSSNKHNIDAGKEDVQFWTGNQWDSVTEQRRRKQNKPVLTVDLIGRFVAQVLGNRLLNETEIRVLPDKDGTKDIANIREGLIRSIFKNSHADFARDEAQKYQVVCGEGYYTLRIDYTGDDVFEQEIKIDAVVDPYSVVLDPMGIEPSGGDCQWGFISDDIPLDEYKKRWPKATAVSFDTQSRWTNDGQWETQDSVRVVSYWRMVTEGHKTLALFQDGSTHDVTELDEADYLPFVATRSDGSPYTREVPNRFAQLYVCSGKEILEGPYDYPISSIPIYRVPGWEANDGTRIQRWGLVRKIKDSQRSYNYWRSVLAEQLVGVARNKWLTTPDAVKGHEQQWRDSPTSDDPFLYYSEDSAAPSAVPPAAVDGALLEQAATSAQDMKEITNIHEAALGMPSNEVSGKAIQQRQMITDIGTAIYVDRLRLADQRCATNINELIPYIYDTMRIATVIGPDDKSLQVTLNNPMDPNSDVTIGKYQVTVTVGPSSLTRRALAAEQMTAFINAAPQFAEPVMHLVADAQDWPKSQEFARIFKSVLATKYPGIIPEDEMTPEMQQAAQQNAEMAQMAQQIEQAQIEADLQAKRAKAANDEARARLAEAQAYKAILDAQSRAADVQSKTGEREAKIENQDFEQTMKVLDQHNSLEREDRDYDTKSNGEKTNERP